MEALQPDGWKRPSGYSNGVSASGTLIFVAGQIGWNADQKFEASGFVEQARQALKNVVAVLSEAGAGPEHVVRMTWYITDKAVYHRSLKDVGGVYREVMGRTFPAMTMVEVSSLMEDEALVEIEATAVLPDE